MASQPSHSTDARGPAPDLGVLPQGPWGVLPHGPAAAPQRFPPFSMSSSFSVRLLQSQSLPLHQIACPRGPAHWPSLSALQTPAHTGVPLLVPGPASRELSLTPHRGHSPGVMRTRPGSPERGSNYVTLSHSLLPIMEPGGVVGAGLCNP